MTDRAPSSSSDPRPWGFSTGALARGDFRQGLAMLHRHRLEAVEISALRLPELPALLEAFDDLALEGFSHVSIHFPSAYPAEEEGALVRRAKSAAAGTPVVVHPDAIVEPGRGVRSTPPS